MCRIFICRMIGGLYFEGEQYPARIAKVRSSLQIFGLQA